MQQDWIDDVTKMVDYLITLPHYDETYINQTGKLKQ